MVKIKDPKLLRRIKSFLVSYLPDTRQKSIQTVQAYKDALNLFVIFLSEEKKISLKDVSVTDFNQDNIVAFLHWLKENRKNESTTINQKLSHIKGFCRYIQKNDLLSFKTYSEICEIAEYKDERIMEFIWLSVEEVKLILKQPDTNKKTGIRDRFFGALLYESGYRNNPDLCKGNR